MHWTSKAILAIACAANAGAAELSDPVVEQGATAPGTAAVEPDSGTAGQYGTWTVTYTAGAGGIQPGGGIRVQLPDEWHAGPRNSANPLRASDPTANHYVKAYCSNPDAEIETVVEGERDEVLIKHAKRSLDGREERYVFVTRAIVRGAPLADGDTISMVYGDRSGGSAGMRASAVSTPPLPVPVAVDADGDNRFRLIENPPLITARPGSAVEMMVHLPSWGVAGRESSGKIVLVDAEANPVDHAARVEVQPAGDTDAGFPATVTIPPGKGFAEFAVTPSETGVLRLKVRAAGLELETLSNPMRVTAEEPPFKLLWGDLHSHSHFSWDGVGRAQFEYARDVSGLDFYALTDHSREPAGDGWQRGLSPESWDEYTALTDRFNDPPRFVALHAYEDSFGAPWGHHNVIFRGAPGYLGSPGTDPLPQLWSKLAAGEALTIPHHTGKFPGGVEFEPQNDEFRRNFEMYSGHGLSETYNPNHPLAFEQSLFTSDARSLTTPAYLHDVWMAGLRFSAIASSDDHRAHPGQPHYGLAAVLADENTRDGVFQALYGRRTYATTGAKIILDFSLNNIPMGQTAKVLYDPELEIAARGTDAIEWVELLRHLPGREGFDVIRRWEPGTLDFGAGYIDSGYQPGAIYCVRLQQERPVRGRAAMAWSSPVWTE